MTKACKEDQNVRFEKDKKWNIAVLHTGYTPGQEKYINVTVLPWISLRNEVAAPKR